MVKPDILARGNQLMQWLPPTLPLAQKYPDNTASINGIPVFRMSGTSAAAPVVSGAVALLLEKDRHSHRTRLRRA